MNKKKKWTILLIIWLIMLVSYLDRVIISVAGPTMMGDLNISPTSFGILLSAFSIGYGIMQIPGGYLADKIGGRTILIVALVWWSIATGLHAVAASLGVLIIIRIFFGMGEGLGPGAQLKLVGDYFKPEERSSANGLFFTAVALGPAFAAPLVAYLVGTIGWKEVFLWFSIPGLLLAFLVYKFIPKQPSTLVNVSTKKEDKTNWKDVLRTSSTWKLFITYFGFNIAFWGFVGWMPSYLSISRNITLSELGFFASAPYVCGFIGMLIMGWLGNKLLYRYRAAMVASSYILAGVFLFVAYSVTTVGLSVIGLSIAGFFLFGGLGPFWATSMDYVPADIRGAFSGFVNFGGQVGGFIAPIVIGFIVDATESFTGGFLFMIGSLVLGAISVFTLRKNKSQNKESSLNESTVS